MKDDDFEWDRTKAAANLANHGVSFERARLVFADPFAVGRFDNREDYGGERFTIVGMVEGTLIFVAYTERGDRVRIITARRATSAPIPKFARACGTSDANFGIKGALATL
ncbi:MAG: BrnT family toxin [Alphaproteobacteria bacterium]|nr:MAG: BrnT family toxin [Alphaproteobacteria bacterium]